MKLPWGESCLVLRQHWVGGGVGDQGKLPVQSSSGEWHGDAAVGGSHHPNDGVLLSGLIFLLYQRDGVVQCSDGLQDNVRLTFQ